MRIIARAIAVLVFALSRFSLCFSTAGAGLSIHDVKNHHCRTDFILAIKGGFSGENDKDDENLNSKNRIQTLVNQAQSLLKERDVDGAMGTLSEIYSLDPNTSGVLRLFESCLRLRVDIGLDANQNVVQDRFGLASLLLDQERYEEASVQLQHIVSDLSVEGDNDIDNNTKVINNNKQQQQEKQDRFLLAKASSMLFRTNAACCRWDTYEKDSQSLVSSLRLNSRAAGRDANDVPVVHPFEALKWPCISIQDASQIAALYARRATVSTLSPSQEEQYWLATEAEVEKNKSMPKTMGGTTTVSTSPRKLTMVSEESVQELTSPKKKIRLGYISPDFTSNHPLAFLMQSVFGHHDKSYFSVHMYALSKDDECSEIRAIKEGSDHFTCLPAGGSPQELADRIKNDEIDILVDLCGYAGTSLVAQILSLRPAPVQISYMGFPGSTGAPYLDYMVCDRIVVPQSLRTHYTERLILMPHCYFVNSHKTCASHTLLETDEEKHKMREKYGLPKDAFVFCCLSRPDKIDPCTFQSWLQALFLVRNRGVHSVLWLLRSGPEMEANLRQIARSEFGLSDSALVFTDICPRDEHLSRLGCADLFLDTPAYNAHTLGCDTLFAGVPMVSLLRTTSLQDTSSDKDNYVNVKKVDTEKLPSRVGASLLIASGLDNMICPTMKIYEEMMIKCATRTEWYNSVRSKLKASRETSPLFDTRRWVKNFELSLKHISSVEKGGTLDDDIVVETI